MKKFLLMAIGCVALAGSTVKAQTSFTTPYDTVTVNYVLGGGTVNVANDITNISNSAIKINWKVVSHNLPNDWLVGNWTGLCDNVTCYSTSNPIANTVTSADYPPNSKNGDFHLQLSAPLTATQGLFYITVNLSSTGGGTKNITFVFRTATSTAVPNIGKSSDDVKLYPNPAHNSVNVEFDPNAGVKLISVYNLIGKPVSTFRVNGSSAQLDISDIPAGVYFIRLMDAQNHVLDTRKFTRQ
ncbi:T9SS type A sorting domain-containing protein [Taibaiella soli]|uniref:Secretion system C-terminal sorting domain-containing protein n=1 Tax=Taibaiella soli TaxID=1649169 RepID=A0A2W2AJ02_9BACT|nr:T9SS type A sorting domain-containing protein [Taibaiella soli]PZF72220.1 hypothetical protein DN068_14915 [Taibaiella soli]